MLALAGGVIAVVLGLFGIAYWWGELLTLIKGGLPVMFILGGALAGYLGFEEIRDKKASESFDAGSTDLEKEVERLKEEIREIKGQKA